MGSAGLYLAIVLALLAGGYLLRLAVTRVIMAKVRHKATIQGRVWRGKGNRFRNPATGRMETCPGGQWFEGREGRWYDHGVMTKEAVMVSAWAWLWTQIRIEINEILKFLKGRIQ